MLTQKTHTRRKTILILDNNSELEQLVREPLQKHFEKSSVTTILVRARDGADAASKSINQKFDIVLIDTEVPRLMDGGFVHGMRTYKNTLDADVIVISQREPSDLPDSLQDARHFKKPFSPEALIEAMIASLNSDGGITYDSAPASIAAHRFAVDVRVINALIKSTVNVLTQFGISSVKMEKAAQKSAHAELEGEVSSVVDIQSPPFQGLLTISFDKPSFLELVSSMLMEEQTDITPDNQDAVGEINNIIFGNAKAELSTYGVAMTVPRVILGLHQSIPCPEGAAAMTIPFATAKGHFYVTVIALPIK